MKILFIKYPILIAFICLLLCTSVIAETLTPTQVAQYAYNAGFRGDGLVYAIAIAGAESRYRTDVVNTEHNVPPSRDRGLWQINDYYHPDVSDACAFDAACSAQAAYKISRNGSNWTPWTTWKNGSYQNYLTEAQVAANAVSSNSGSGNTMPSGWYWPSGSGDFGGYLGWLGYNNATYPWHLAQDMKCAPTGHAVYSIGDGDVILSRTNVSGYGLNYGPGGALVARYQAADGTWFTALYGHLNAPHGNGHVSAGDVIGYTNDFEPPHVHFAIHPGFDPEPNDPWRGYTSDKNVTYGFTDPIPFLNAHARGTVNPPPAVTTIVSESDNAASDGAPGFFRHGTPGFWHDATDSGDGGHMLWTYTNGNSLDNLGDWRPNLPDTRNYEVFVFIPALHATTHKAHYEIYGADGRTDKVIDQYAYTNVWVSLGTYRFNAGTSGLLRLDDGYNEPYNGSTKVGFDTAKWEARDAPDTTPPTVTITSGQTSGATYNTPQNLTWSISDDASGLKSWGQGWDSDPGDTTYTTTNGNLDLPVGTHTLHIHVVDNAGNDKDWTFGPYTYSPQTQVGQKSDGTIDQRFVDCYNRIGPSIIGRVLNNNFVHAATGNGNGDGLAQDFVDGSSAQNIIIAKDGADKAYDVRGNLWTWYSAIGYANSPAGFPNGDMQTISAAASGTVGFDASGTVQTFEGGWIYDSTYGTHLVPQSIMSGLSLATIVKMINGTFGFPTTDFAACGPSPQGTVGQQGIFEHGGLYSGTNRVGVHGVSGTIFNKYVAAGTVGGKYGFPISDPYAYQGGTKQDFEGGSLTSGITPVLHILWDNTNGAASLWNYTPSTGGFTQITYGPFAGWTAKAIADGGTDGKTRLLWDNANGTASFWSLDNTTGAYTHHEFGPYPAWTASAISVAASNTTHILWTNTNGAASLWNYNTSNGTFTQITYGPFAGWTAKAIADGGTDGKTRLLWDNANGTASFWSLDNTTGAYTHHEFGPYPAWTASAISVAASNTTHVLWKNANGTVSLWNYNASTGGFTQISYGPFAGWGGSGVTDSADGRSDLLWNNVSGAASFWSLDNTTGAYTHHEFGPYPAWTATAITSGD